MHLQPKKVFAVVNYKICDPRQCDPGEGACAAAKACKHRVIKQIDGRFKQPMVFQDMCQGCWDCLEACPLGAVQRKRID